MPPPFFCTVCYQAKCEKEISNLNSTVASLTKELSDLKQMFLELKVHPSTNSLTVVEPTRLTLNRKNHVIVENDIPRNQENHSAQFSKKVLEELEVVVLGVYLNWVEE